MLLLDRDVEIVIKKESLDQEKDQRELWLRELKFPTGCLTACVDEALNTCESAASTQSGHPIPQEMREEQPFNHCYQASLTIARICLTDHLRSFRVATSGVASELLPPGMSTL